MSKPTPGKWIIKGTDVFDSGGLTICVTPAVHQEGLANARLIAAAPDLFAALVSLVECHNSNHQSDALLQRRAEMPPNDNKHPGEIKALIAARAAIARATGDEEPSA